MSRKAKLLLWIIIGIVIISVAGICWYKYSNNWKHEADTDENKLPAIKITLTNGCGFAGLANEFADFLADKNVDIVARGNAKPIYDKTIIVVRKGDEQDLKRLMQMTGITRTTQALSPYALGDFEIIIGKDYEQYTKK